MINIEKDFDVHIKWNEFVAIFLLELKSSMFIVCSGNETFSSNILRCFTSHLRSTKRMKRIKESNKKNRRIEKKKIESNSMPSEWNTFSCSGTLCVCVCVYWTNLFFRFHWFSLTFSLFANRLATPQLFAHHSIAYDHNDHWNAVCQH